MQIQISAMAVATSFLLIGIPNVETLSITAFLVGFLFPSTFALITVITMAITWEVLASMVFFFSGITFVFKIVAWTTISMIGVIARKIGVKYFIEFSIIGALCGILYDLFVTIPIPLFFVDNQSAFFSVLMANLIVGIVFTLSHTISNSLLFALIPFVLKTVLPLLYNNYAELVQINRGHFDYLSTDGEIRIVEWGNISKKRILGYIGATLIIIILLTAATLNYYSNNKPGESLQDVEIDLRIHYDGIIKNETHLLNISSNTSVFLALRSVAIVNYTKDLGNVFVEAINHVWANLNLSNHYWIYYVNGEPPQTGAGTYFPNNGDIILWNYED